MTNFGHYEILGTLGSGSFATVYRAREPVLNRVVALKALLPHLAADAEDRGRFIAEARALAALHHPNIVTVFEAGEVEGRPFFAMELVEGETLAALVRRAGPLSVERTLPIISSLAAALDVVHASGLVHRDVKDSNVIIEPSGRVVLMDFGIALAMNQARLTQAGYGMGTPESAAPEQIRGLRVGPAADIYALGVLTYQLLAGQLPFSGDVAHVLYAHAHLPPPPLCDRRPDLPAAVCAVVASALAKDATARPGSAGAFASALADPDPSGIQSSLPPAPVRATRSAATRASSRARGVRDLQPLSQVAQTAAAKASAWAQGATDLQPLSRAARSAAAGASAWVKGSTAPTPFPRASRHEFTSQAPSALAAPPLRQDGQRAHLERVQVAGAAGAELVSYRARSDGSATCEAVHLAAGLTLFRFVQRSPRFARLSAVLREEDGNLLAWLVDARRGERPYRGTRGIVVRDDAKYMVTVETPAPWVLEIEQPHIALQACVTRASGVGDEVIFMRLDAGVRRWLIRHEVWTGSRFSVVLVDSAGQHVDNLVTTDGGFMGSAERRISEAGVHALIVEAEGSWSISVA